MAVPHELSVYLLSSVLYAMKTGSSDIMIMSAPSSTASAKPATSVAVVTRLLIPSLLTIASTDLANPPMIPSPEVTGTAAAVNLERS